MGIPFLHLLGRLRWYINADKVDGEVDLAAVLFVLLLEMQGKLNEKRDLNWLCLCVN